MSCGPCGNNFNTPQEYLNFVYKLPVLLEQEISVMETQRQRIYLNMPTKGELPANVGTNYQKMAVHTPRFRQFNNSEIYHSKQDRAHGPTAAGAENAHCTVGPFHKLNGLGYERLTLQHRRAFFETCDFCVETLWRENVAPEEFFAEYMRGIREQLDDIMEITHRNEYEERAQKVWAIYNSDGRLVQNPTNPFDWASLPGTATLSLPSIEMLYNFAEDVLASYADYYMIGTMDGEPVYPLVMNSRTKHNLVWKNKQLITSIQFSSLADSLIEMWQGPLSKIGPFVIFVDNDSTRLKRDLVTGAILQVPHWVPIPASDGGTQWVEHPEWHSRGTDFVDTIMIPRKDVWKKLIRRIPKTLAGVDFGDDLSPELGLTYINIRDKCCNPFGWIGHFVATHEYYVEPGQNIGVAPCYIMGVNSGVPGTDMLYEEPETCPTTPVVCNRVDLAACPCPSITCIVPNPLNREQAYFTFGNAITPAPAIGGTIVMKVRTGTTQTFTIADLPNVDAPSTYLLTLPVGASANGPLDPEDYTEVACEVVTYCASDVLGIDDCRSEVSNAVKIRLVQNIRCNAFGDLITLSFKDGYRANFSILSANAGTGWYTVRYAAGFGPTDDPLGLVPATSTWDLCCDRGTPMSACCVPTVGNGCLGCDVTFEQCDGTLVAGDIPRPCGTCSE